MFSHQKKSREHLEHDTAYDRELAEEETAHRVQRRDKKVAAHETRNKLSWHMRFNFQNTHNGVRATPSHYQPRTTEATERRRNTVKF